MVYSLVWVGFSEGYILNQCINGVLSRLQNATVVQLRKQMWVFEAPNWGFSVS